MAGASVDPALATEARHLMRRCDRASLGTVLAGAPYVSLVLVAFDFDATPLLLLSDLAQHTRNLAAEPRASLLFDGTVGLPDPLAGPRLTVLGRARASTDRNPLARFAARHPSSAAYAGFGDFRLYRVAIERGHLVAGFGKIDWIGGDQLRFSPPADSLAATADDIVEHMNANHADAVALYARRLLGRAGEGWRMTGIDPEGVDLRGDDGIARLDFADSVLTAAAARAALIALVQQARALPDGRQSADWD